MKKKLISFLKIAVSLLLLYLLFTRLDLQQVAGQFRNIRWPLLVLGFLVLIFQTAASSLKWKYILRADGSDIPFLFLWKTYWIGNFLSLFLPSSIGGDVYRIAAVKGASQSLGKSASSVLFDRMTGLFALISIAFIAGILLPENPVGMLTTIFYLAIVLAFLVLTSDFAPRLLARFNTRLTRPALKVFSSFSAYRRDKGSMLVIFSLAFLFQFVIVILNKVYTLALGMDVPFERLMLVIPMIYLTEVLPISINGLGVRESAFAFFFVLIGRTREEGLAVALLVVFLRYLASGLGGLLMLADTMLNKKDAEQAVAQPTVGDSD